MKAIRGMLFLWALLLPLSATAANVVRYPLLGGSKFPIARAVEVPAGTTLIFHSGVTPSPSDASPWPNCAEISWLYSGKRAVVSTTPGARPRKKRSMY